MHRLHVSAGAILLFAGVVALGQDGGTKGPKKKLDSEQMLKRFDANGDGVLDESELPELMRQRFAQMDRNGDGKVDLKELNAMARSQANPPVQPDALFILLDTDGDGKLSPAELANATKALDRFDRNKDGFFDRDELYAPGRKNPGRPGEIITPAAKAERIADKLKVGDQAPTFTLPLVNGKGTVALADFKDKKPVVLIFASYT